MQPNYDALYRGLVTSNIDVTNSGKIRVQCPQIAGMAEIRSAEPMNPQDPVPAVGTTVWLAFSGGDITKPTYASNTSYIINTGTTLYPTAPLVGLEPGGLVATWHTPVYKTLWSAGSAFNGLSGSALRYRIDAEDNVWLLGLATVASGGGQTVFTLPSGFYNTNPSGRGMGSVITNSTGTVDAAVGCIIDSTTGNVNVLPLNSGNTYLFNFKSPLGNIT